MGGLLCANHAAGQARDDRVNWKAVSDSTLGAAVLAEDVPGAVVVVVGGDSTLFSAAFGMSRVEDGAPVTTATLFEVGSLGKVLTAMAVLQQVERGRLNLSADVNAYLDDWKLEPPGEAPLTLHHLLTHSGGLNDRGIGYAARRPEDVEPLGPHLANNFPTFFAEPEAYISYSNYGFGLAGYAVESVSGRPFADYVSTEILTPLGIDASGYDPGGSDDLAKGYRKTPGGFSPAPTVYRPVTPAGSFVASADDMGLLLRALLRGGGPVLSEASVGQMTQVRKTMHPDLMGNAYGLEESRWGTIQGFGKGGSIPGFTAYMVLIPELDVGLFVAVNGSTDEPIDRFVLAAMNTLSGAPGPPTETAAPEADLTKLTGEYRNNRYDRTTLEKLLNFDVRAIYPDAEGGLAIWHDGSMNQYLHVGGGLFQHADHPERKLYFETDSDGDATHAYFNDRIAGGYLPVVWEKNGLLNSNLYVNEYFGIVVLFGLSYLLFPLIAALTRFIRRRRSRRPRVPRILRWKNLAGFMASGLLLSGALFFFIPLLRARPELVFGIPDEVANRSFLLPSILAGFGVFAAFWVMAIRQRAMRWPAQVHGLVFVVSGVLILEFFLRWNLL